MTAPGSSTNMFVNILLAKDGLKPDAVSIIGVGAGAGAVAIMKRGEIDAISNLDPVISMLEAGGDIVPQTVKLAMQSPWPVKVIWPREEEVGHGTYRPQTAISLKAALGADGKVSAWLHRSAYPSINATFTPDVRDRKSVV